MDRVKALLKKELKKTGFDIKRIKGIHSLEYRFMHLFDAFEINKVFDVGASKGQYGSWLRRAGFKGQIISYEPVKQAHELLVKRSRKDKNWIVPLPTALGDEKGKKEINVSQNLASSSLLDIFDIHLKAAQRARYVSAETVDIRRLDSIAAEYMEPDDRLFLKIDVQGYEYRVLKGAEGILPEMLGIQVELSSVALYKGQVLFNSVMNYILNAGFELYELIPGLRDKKSGRLYQFDGLFFRKSKIQS